MRNARLRAIEEEIKEIDDWYSRNITTTRAYQIKIRLLTEARQIEQDELREIKWHYEQLQNEYDILESKYEYLNEQHGGW